MYEKQLLNRRHPVKETPPELATYKFRRDSYWARFYFWCYHSFPRDLCTYFWQSTVMVLWSLSAVIGGSAVLFGGSALLGVIVYYIYLFIPAIPAIARRIPALMVGASSFWVSCLTVIILLGFLIFFRSSLWWMMRARWRAFKEKTCPLIRFE